MGDFPSGQRGQTVNLLATPSVVRIHLRPVAYQSKLKSISAQRVMALDLSPSMHQVHKECRSGGTGRRPGLKIPWVVIPVPVRFRSAALMKSERNVEFTAFLLFFCFQKFEHL